MSSVRVEITPNITIQRATSSRIEDHRLEFADFAGKNDAREVRFHFGNHSVSYGVCALFDYYADICQELYSMIQGVNHDIEMSGYPVGSVKFTPKGSINVTIFGADRNGKPKDYRVSISKDAFIAALRDAKASIEDHVKERGNLEA